MERRRGGEGRSVPGSSYWVDQSSQMRLRERFSYMTIKLTVARCVTLTSKYTITVFQLDSAQTCWKRGLELN